MPAGWAAVVTAAGASARMGGAKKEFRSLGGVPVLALAIRPFLAGAARRVVVTLPAGRLAEASALLAPHVDLASLALVEGGATRQESVRRGLLALADDPPDIVLIHDGARPWLCADLLARVLASAERHGACVPVLEAAEAVKEVDLAAGGQAAGAGWRTSCADTSPVTPSCSPRRPRASRTARSSRRTRKPARKGSASSTMPRSSTVSPAPWRG